MKGQSRERTIKERTIQRKDNPEKGQSRERTIKERTIKERAIKERAIQRKDNPEKGQSREASNIGTQDEEKQNTTQYMLDTTIHNQTQGKDEPNIVLCANRNGHHTT